MQKKVANCQSKKVYRTAKKAIKAKDRYAINEMMAEYQRPYRCDVCWL